VYIGLSGYSYKAWQGPRRFYPQSVRPEDFLSYYASRYPAVELDGVWYRFPSPQTVQSWIEKTPAPFLFSPKAHRSITHLQRLKPPALTIVHDLLERLSPLAQQGRLGPVLLQLPPNLRRDDERLESFLQGLPKAARWAFEFRHASWNVSEIETLLRAYGIAWAAVETDDAPAERRDTAGFCYVRLRRSDYRTKDIEEWADWLKEQTAEHKPCFVFVKHRDEGSPWRCADRLRALL
jgi:uncharacterized protein YecE (DUF72 family)